MHTAPVALTTFCAVAFLPSCSGIPAKVTKISDPSSSTTGVRYHLGRPEFDVFLRWNPKVQHYDVILEQSLTQGDLYEIQTKRHLLANTHVSVTLDDKGYLTGFSAGDEDQTAMFVAAVAATVGAAAGVATIPGPIPPGVQQYQTDHTALIAYQTHVQAALKDARAKLPSIATANDARMRELRLLQTELEDITKRITKHRFKVPRSHVAITVGGKQIPGYGTPGPVWVRVDL